MEYKGVLLLKDIQEEYVKDSIIKKIELLPNEACCKIRSIEYSNVHFRNDYDSSYCFCIIIEYKSKDGKLSREIQLKNFPELEIYDVNIQLIKSPNSLDCWGVVCKDLDEAIKKINELNMQEIKPPNTPNCWEAVCEDLEKVRKKMSKFKRDTNN